MSMPINSMIDQFRLFDLLPDPVQIVDQDGHILFMNAQMKSLFGDLQGCICYQSIKKSGQECDNCPRRLSGADYVHKQVEIETAIDRKMLVSHTAFPLQGRTCILECYKDVTEYRRALQEETRTRLELEMAKEIQTRCMTMNLRGTGLLYNYRYIAARTVAGDFLQATVSLAGQAWIVLGDVAGHGAGAAALTFMIKAVYDQLVEEQLPPARWPGELNRRLYRYLFPNRFFTFVLVCLDWENRTYRIINAGHPPVLHLRKEQKPLLIHKAQLPPVGVLEDMPAAPDSSDSPITPGDRLLFYSDGLFQLFDNSFDDFLAKIETWSDVPTSSFIERVLPEPLETLRDDLTLLIVET